MTPDERSMAKMVNFGIAYGMSDFGLSTRAGISRQEAQAFISNYFATYSGISYYMLHIKDVAKKQGYVTTLLGRKRSIPELAVAHPGAARGGGADGHQHADPGHGRGHHEDRDDPGRRAAGGRGLAGDGCCCRCTTSCSSRCRGRTSTRWSRLVRETMESALPLDVPLTVDVKAGDDWESMRPVPRPPGAAASRRPPRPSRPAEPNRPMPELPEVETVARDLRPRLVGATIVGARVFVGTDVATHDPVAFAEAVAGRRSSRSDGGRSSSSSTCRGCRPDHPSQDDRPAVRGAGRDAGGPVHPTRPGARGRP